MNRPRPRLRVEELESRTLLTGTSVAPFVLTGTAGGTYALGPSLPTTGTTYELAGTGTVGPLGKVTVSGFLQAARHTDAALRWSMGPGRASRHGSRWAIRSAPVPRSRTLPCPTLQERMRAEAETVDPRESMATTP